MSSQEKREPSFAEMIDELRAIRNLLSAVLEHREQQSALADTNAEIAMVIATGTDPVDYLKKRAKSMNASIKKPKRGRKNART